MTWNRIQALFEGTEPEVTVSMVEPDKTGAEGAELRLLLQDCDGYRLGFLVFSDVRLVCLPTQWENFIGIRRFQREDLPTEFEWFEEGMQEGVQLFCLERPDDDEDIVSVLPWFGGKRQGLVLAASVELKPAPLGR